MQELLESGVVKCLEGQNKADIFWDNREAIENINAGRTDAWLGMDIADDGGFTIKYIVLTSEIRARGRDYLHIECISKANDAPALDKADWLTIERSLMAYGKERGKAGAIINIRSSMRDMTPALRKARVLTTLDIVEVRF